MSNHIHLLTKKGMEPIANSFRRIGASFVYWHNWKYTQRGICFRIAKKVKQLRQIVFFNCYQEYTKKPELYDAQVDLSLFSKNPQEAVTLWEKINQENNHK